MIIRKIRDWFLSPYRDATLEVRKKMDFLVVLGILVLFIYIPVTILGPFQQEMGGVGLGADAVVPLSVLLALFFVRKGKPEWAVNSLMLTLVTTFFGSVVMALLVEWPIQEIREFIPFIISSNISQTTLILIFELLVISLFAIRKYQLKMYISASFFIVAVQYIVLAYKLNNGHILDFGVFPVFQLVFLLFSSVVAYLINALSKALLRIAERSLHESEERYRILIENLREGVFILTGDTVEFTNRSFANLYGLNPEDLKGTRLLDLIDSRYHEEIRHKMSRRADGDRTHWEYEVGTVPVDGESKLLSLSTTVVSYYGKSAVMGTARDVTEKRRVEEAVRLSEKKYRGLFEGSPIPHTAQDWTGVKHRFDELRSRGVTDIRRYFTDNPEEVEKCFSLVRMIETNQASLELFGARTQDELFMNIDKVMRKDSRAVLFNEFLSLAEGKSSFSSEQISYRLDGVRIHCIVHVNVLPGYEENLERIIVSMVDITARKRAEEELLRRDRMLSGVNRAVEELISRGDFSGSVHRALGFLGEQVEVDRVLIYANGDYGENGEGRPTSSLAFAWASERADLQTSADTSREVPYAGGFERWYRILSKGEAVEGSVRHFPEEERRIIGSEDVKSLVAVPILVRDAFWGYLRFDDCTADRRWSESEKYIFSTFAGILGEAIARNGYEMDLMKAKEEAEAATRSKSEFLANMSHEIRTPMNAITGMTALAHKQELTPKLKEYLTVIENSSRSLLSLINDILDFSKIEAGKMEIEETDFYLNDILEQLSDLFRGKAAEKNIELVVCAGPDVPQALIGDPLRLSQIYTNLVSNSVKFTEKGQIVVWVTVDEADAEAAVLRSTVEDTGIGIEEEKLHLLFESFTQADGSTTRKFGGTGLGLAICRSLIELMDGEITVDSVRNRGTRFEFVLTLRRQPPERERRRALPGTIRDLKVLVVDDNRAARLMMQEMLEAFSFSVEAAVTGEGALELLRGGGDRFDLVLMDWRMPGIDGLETISMVREMDEYRTVPVILMTAFGSHEDVEAIDETLIDAFVLKPVKQSVLFDTIVQLFDKNAELVRASEDYGVLTRTKMYQERLKGAYVLLVEDNPVNQQVAAEILADASIRVDVASDGKQAVQMVRDGEYDGVLMDVQMPDMDGFEATRRIRSAGGFEHLPIIAMTANAMKGDRERCLASGMNDYIAKPIDVDQLFDTMRKWLSTRPHGEAEGPAERAGTERSGTAGAPGGPAGGRRPDAGSAAPRETDIPDVDIPDVEGIDSAGALKRLGGRKELYLRLLRDFARTQGAAAAKVPGCLEGGDLDTAGRTVHTIKGLAGGIGADRTVRIAGTLEAAIRREDLPEAVRGAAELEEEVRAIVERIEAAVAPAGLRPGSGGENRELLPEEKAELAALVERLDRLLGENDIDAEEVFTKTADLARRTRYAPNLEEIRAKIEAYDFAEAREALKGMDFDG